MTSETFAKKVVTSYKESKGVFSNKVNAEDHLPAGIGKKEAALFLFYVIQLDYATKSQRLYQGAKKLYKDYPSFYSPKTILHLKKEELKKYLKDYLSPRYINEALKRYTMNSSKLLDEYEGNPLHIFQQSKSAKEALRKVREFRGFGPKIGNFLVRTMINTFDFNYQDIESILPPVDVHDVRIAYLMGFVDSGKMSSKNIQKVKEVWSNACKDAGESWLVFDKALWLLGSEGRPQSKADVINLLG